MPLFVNPQDVILRMQLSPDLTGIEEVVTSGIIGAQLHVERLIDSKLCRRSQNALYFVDAESFSGIAPSGLYRLEIPSGLVRQDVPQVVTVADGAVNGPFATYEAIDTGLMKFDYPRGYLYVDADTYGNHHVKVQCDTGFEDGTRPLSVAGLPVWSASTSYAAGQTVAYTGVAYQCKLASPAGTLPTNPSYWTMAYAPQEPIPNDIYEAIMALVPMVFNSQQTTNRANEAKDQYLALASHAELLLQPYVRTKGFTFRAL